MHGLIVLDKAAGISSHDALRPVKSAVGRGVKVGHAGTLDPFATGVLLTLLGKATRLSDVAMGMKKAYEATVLFGVATDTLDPEGEVTDEADPGPAPPPEFESALIPFRGEIEQVPPAYSALKVDGRRAYKLARAGDAPEMAARPVTVHGLYLAAVDWPSVRLEVVCGAGTYIRSLARDLGKAIGLPAHLTALRRTAIGPFRADCGLTGVPSAADLKSALVAPLDVTRAAGLFEVPLPAETAALFALGQAVEADTPTADRVAVVDERGMVLLGIGRADRPGLLQPVRVFAGSDGPA